MPGRATMNECTSWTWGSTATTTSTLEARMTLQRMSKAWLNTGAAVRGAVVVECASLHSL